MTQSTEMAHEAQIVGPIGLVLPSMGQKVSVETIEAAAEVASSVGWLDLWAGDHVLVDSSSAERFGMTLDPLVILTHIAARHPSVRIGTAVLIVALRNAVTLAKELASLDHVAHGRLRVGVAAGWNTSEFASIVPGDRFQERGAYLDEALDLWRHLWSGSSKPFSGEFHTLRDYAFGPIPPQRDRIPIWIGGDSSAALKRVIRRGDGYLARQMSPMELSLRRDFLAREADAAGLRCPTIGVWYAVTTTDIRKPSLLARRVKEQWRSGADQVLLSLAASDPAALTRDIERLSTSL